MRVYTITQGAELPDLPFDWRDHNRLVVPYSTGWTFRLTLATVRAPGTLVLSKTSAIAGFDTVPNVVVGFSPSGELNLLDPGDHVGELWAVRDADNKERGPVRFLLRVKPRLGP